MTKHNPNSAKILKFPTQNRPHGENGDLSFDVARHPRPASSQPSSEQKRVETKGWKLTERGKRVAWVLGGVATTSIVGASIAMLAHHEKQNDLPDPKPSGETVRVYPQEGEGVNQMVYDLSRPGYDNDKLHDLIDGARDENGNLQRTPIEVDTGFLTTDEDVLLEYGVQPGDYKVQK